MKHYNKLWILASYFQMPELQNRTMDTIIWALARPHYKYCDIYRDLQTLPRESPLRRFWVYNTCKERKVDLYKSVDDGNFTGWFLKDVVRQMNREIEMIENAPLTALDLGGWSDDDLLDLLFQLVDKRNSSGPRFPRRFSIHVE